MSLRKNQVTTTLLQFYEKPIANVSIELFFSIGTVIVFALFSIRPTLLTMSNLVKELGDKRELNEKLRNKVAALSSAQTEYLSLQSELSVLDEALPSTPKFDTAVLIIEKIASDNRLTIEKLSAQEIPQEPSTQTDSDRMTRISRPITVTVTGDFTTLRKFLEDVRNTQRTLVVNSVTFSTFELEGKKNLRAVITISVQYFGLDKNAATPSATNTSGAAL